MIKNDKIILLYNIIINLSLIELFYFLIKKYKFNNKKKLLFLLLTFVILFSCKYLLKIKKLKKKNYIYLLLITAIADIFQEITGKLIGKNKIFKISPNKTLEGYIGGFIFSLICGKIIFKKKLKYSILIYLMNISGDLFFSYLKRLFLVKDFSNILLDHGGILDRYDSLFFPIITMNLLSKY